MEIVSSSKKADVTDKPVPLLENELCFVGSNWTRKMQF
jgi:hypothetical protein